MSSMEEVFQVLQLEPTTDKRAIKRSYANLVKQYHPEENPEKWKEIHDAYKMAERYAGNFPTVMWEDLEEEQEEPQQELIEEKKNIFFSYTPIEQEDVEEDLLTYIGGQLEEKRKQREAHVIYMRRMALRDLKTMKSVYDRNKWEVFFKQYPVEYLCCEEILTEWGKIVSEMSYEEKLINYFQKRLDEIKDFCKKYGIVFTEEDGTNPIRKIQSAIDKKEGKSFILWLLLIALSISVWVLAEPVGTFISDLFSKAQTNSEAENPVADVSKLSKDMYWQRDFQKKIEGKTNKDIQIMVEAKIPLSEGMYFWEYPFPVYEEGITLMPVTNSFINLPEESESILYAGQITSLKHEFAGFLCINTKILGVDDFENIYIKQDERLIKVSDYKENKEVNEDTVLYFERGDYTLFWLKIPPSENKTGVTFLLTK